MKKLSLFFLLMVPALVKAETTRRPSMTIFAEGLRQNLDYMQSGQQISSIEENGFSGLALFQSPITQTLDVMFQFSVGHTRDDFTPILNSSNPENIELKGVGFKFGAGLKIYLKK